jgi:hypothetical protein
MQSPPPSRERTRSIRPQYVLFAILLLLFIKQFHRPLEEYAGVEVNFKTPNVLRPDNETLARLSNQKSFEMVDKTLQDSTDESQDDSHESVLQALTHPAIKMLEEYQFHHSQHQLEVELENCRERSNLDKGVTIKDVVSNGWCPEFEQRKFLVVEANCKSPETLREYLRVISWAIVTDRVLLWRDDDVKHGTGSCHGLLDKADWVAPYDQWKEELDLGEIVVLDIKDIDKEDTSARVIQLHNPPSLHHLHLKNSESQRKANQLMSDSMLYGILLEEALNFDPKILPKKMKKTKKMKKAPKEKVNTYVIQTVGNYASMPDCMQGFVKSPCVVYQIGEGSIQPMLDGNTCVIHRVGPESGKNFVETLALAAEARAGVMLPQKPPLSTLLTELIAYRGRMDDEDFEMKTCLYAGKKYNLRN